MQQNTRQSVWQKVWQGAWAQNGWAQKLLRFIGAGLLAAGLLAPSAALAQRKDAMKITITVNGKALSAWLYYNSSAQALTELLQKGAVTVHMHDYSNFEKVGELSVSLPRNDTPTDTDAGDLILYQGRSFVIYYDKNSWNFTPLGKLENITKSELKALLGKGDVTAVLQNAN